MELTEVQIRALHKLTFRPQTLYELQERERTLDVLTRLGYAIKCDSEISNSFVTYKYNINKSLEGHNIIYF